MGNKGVVRKGSGGFVRRRRTLDCFRIGMPFERSRVVRKDRFAHPSGIRNFWKSGLRKILPSGCTDWWNFANYPHLNSAVSKVSSLITAEAESRCLVSLAAAEDGGERSQPAEIPQWSWDCVDALRFYSFADVRVWTPLRRIGVALPFSWDC